VSFVFQLITSSSIAYKELLCHVRYWYVIQEAILCYICQKTMLCYVVQGCYVLYVPLLHYETIYAQYIFHSKSCYNTSLPEWITVFSVIHNINNSLQVNMSKYCIYSKQFCSQNQRSKKHSIVISRLR